jgi:SPP1 gp7 family putative phage head morphogenesis protein
MSIRAPSNRSITLPAIHPNQGLQAAYKKKLLSLIDAMQKSVVYWISAKYKANKPEMAQDASPAMTLRQAMNRLSKYWQKRFDEAGPELAKYFANHSYKNVDRSMMDALRKAGFVVDFKLTKEANDALQSVIGENISLIKSIPSEYFTQVEGIVMRSVAQGRELKHLSQELEDRYGITSRRAALIARDQNNKATAVITRVRQEGLGITEAIWLHSHGGKMPRPDHVRADGKVYKIKDGMFLEGKWTWPGHEINCRCVSKSIIPGLDD